ncbi:MAG: hypothetical protein HY699_19360 [Deltaproteobacteria bacterium]|nr:hypothetical protein [Deltaproteobacteria bacterium]
MRRRVPSRLVELTDVGRVLNQDLRWVERCMRLHGRRALKPAPIHPERKEEEDEAFELREPEEYPAELVGEPREREEPPEKPRYLKAKPTPTPPNAMREE